MENKTLRDSAAIRWTALLLLALAMFCAYIFVDILSPIKDLMQSQRGWESDAFGTMQGSETFLNVFIFFLIFAGIILDKMGVRFTALLSGGVMLVGACIKWYAVSDGFIGSGLETWFTNNLNHIPVFEQLGVSPFYEGMPASAKLAAIGFMLFGCGTEMAGISVSRGIVKWFKGKEMALAMGLEMATARIGTTLAMVLTVPLADFFGSTDESGTFHTNIPAPILFCLIMLCVGTIAFFLYTFYDKKLDASLDAEGLEPEEPFRMKDIVYIITNKGFWLIALLCVLFYSAVFPFIKYAADLMVQKYNVDPKLAGTIPGLLPIGAIILTPLFGSLYDRIGKGATLMIIGSVMLIFVHTMFALPILNIWWFATIIMIILGFAFSLVPSAMWPSVPKIIPEKQLGTAYALIFWVQNWGLMGVPLLIGWVLNTYCKGPVVDGAQTYDYTLPMAIFALFGVLALIVALMLKAENKKKGYGLEEANIQK